MRVLHIYKDCYPPVCGGIEISIHRIIDATRDDCDEISVLVCNRQFKSEFAEVEGTPVFKVGEWGRFLSAPIAPMFPYWLRKIRADILHYHLPNPTAVLSHLLVRPKGKVVVHYHSDIIRQKRWMRFYGPFQRRFLQLADKIIVTSPNYLETSETLAPFRQKCEVIPFGINTSRFSPTSEIEDIAQVIRRRYGMGLVLFVGILRYYKGIHVLIDAMEHVEGKALIVGDGPLLPELMEYAHSKPYRDRIQFVGAVESVIPYYYAADVFCLPSIYRSEAFGMVLLEASACSLPLVTTEIGTGTSHVNLDGFTGYVVPPKDPEALAQALRTLLGESSLRYRFGREARKRVVNYFSQEEMARKIIYVYNSLMGYV